ncbi:hypothetical protein [Actinomadura sp. 6N118]|uniref:hypothetical protein n=1 Tax=Actinomadura sp. 6N118 TaxID=3375151 RepID=UPI0037BBB857
MSRGSVPGKFSAGDPFAFSNALPRLIPESGGTGMSRVELGLHVLDDIALQGNPEDQARRPVAEHRSQRDVQAVQLEPVAVRSTIGHRQATGHRHLPVMVMVVPAAALGLLVAMPSFGFRCGLRQSAGSGLGTLVIAMGERFRRFLQKPRHLVPKTHVDAYSRRGDLLPHAPRSRLKLLNRLSADNKEIRLGWSEGRPPAAPPDLPFPGQAHSGVSGHRHDQRPRPLGRQPEQRLAQTHRKAPSRQA